MDPRRRHALLAALPCMLLLVAGPPARGRAEPAAPPFATHTEPIVLAGADVPGLAGASPASIVAWRYHAGWEQIPVQVDERTTVDAAVIYHRPDPTGVKLTVYADPRTWTGADPDATLDADDEVVFMAGDAGERAPSGPGPAGVTGQPGVEVALSDRAAPGATGYVYLFRQAGGLEPSAGARYVTYTFKLDAGDYKTVYDPMRGPNHEQSRVSTTAYVAGFSDRWVNDELRMVKEGVAGPDILDRHGVQFAPASCARSERTFADGVAPYPVGTFIANISGPVRAIRSYMGANSGPLTQRDHLFYARRQEVRTTLRVHSIPGIVDFLDFSAAALGMRYYSSAGPAAGVSIDGQGDLAPAALPAWELVAGEQGALTSVYTLASDLPGLSPVPFYQDASAPSMATCAGDTHAYGASGLWLDQTIACTDPLPAALGGTCPGSFRSLSTRRVLFFDAAGATTADATLHAGEVTSPLVATTDPWQPAAPPSPTAPTDTTTTPTTTTTPSPTKPGPRSLVSLPSLAKGP